MFATDYHGQLGKGRRRSVRKAQREFERLEDVPNWKCHAQFLEVESRDIVRK